MKENILIDISIGFAVKKSTGLQGEIKMNFDKITEYLNSLVQNRIAPSTDCIITQNHKQIYRYFTGFSDIKNKTAVNGNEQYIIFSMTKMVTCVCALQLLEQGKYQLDDPLCMYMPEFSKMHVKTESIIPSVSHTPITIRHLFSMSAGFNYKVDERCIQKAAKKKGSNTQSIVSSFSKTILDFEPGTHFQYSLCHDVLGALIELWSGMKFSEYFDENLAKPLGMKHSFFAKYHNEDVENLAQVYKVNPNADFDDRPQWNPYILSDDYESGGAGLISTTEDYSLFLDALANNGVAANGNKILQESSVDLIKTNQLSDAQLEDFHKMRKGYGYGLGVRTHMQPEASGSLSPVGEFGWDGAAGAFSMVDTTNNISLTYFQHALSWDVKTHERLRNLLYEALDK